jgi:hypothetical protein
VVEWLERDFGRGEKEVGGVRGKDREVKVRAMVRAIFDGSGPGCKVMKASGDENGVKRCGTAIVGDERKRDWM